MEVWLLGALEVVGETDRPVVAGAKQRALLALLALAGGEPVSTDQLVDALWGPAPPANPANALQAHVAQLRRSLGATGVLTRPPGYALGDGIEVDVARFERLVDEGRRALAADPAGAAACLERALALCRGEPLADFVYEDWATAERARLAEARWQALEARLEADLACGRHHEVLAELEACCADAPLRERLWALRMTALYRSGRQADALRAFAEVRAALVEELGIEPGAALQALERRILDQDPALATASVPTVAGDRTIAGPAPIGTRVGTGVRPARTRFFGREEERARLVGAWVSTRLVTLVGPGGAGKTRLATEEAVRRGPEHDQGVWWVDLAGVTDAAGVVPAIAAALPAPDATGRPAPGDAARAPVAALGAQLVGWSALVVLDNCEQVVDEVASVVDELLAACPGLSVLATSREPLRVEGEVLVAVGPLDPEDALALFEDRARAVAPSFARTAEATATAEEVCRRLDGLPLAIELAAARTRALPLADVAERLDDRFRLLTGGSRTALPRHQTLRAVVDWSYDLLFEDERVLLARLGVFAGGFTVEAAEAVGAGGPVQQVEVLDLLLRLVDRSLVTAAPEGGGTRFGLLQTVAEYARERLAASGEEDEVRGRHAAFHRTLAEAAREGLRGPDGPDWRARLAAGVDDLRAALDWSVRKGDGEGALRLATGVAWWWFIEADFGEAARWLADALAVDGASSVEARSLAHAWHGYFSGILADPAEHVGECERAVEDLEGSADLVARAEALELLASTLTRASRFEQSLRTLDDARPLLEAAGHDWGLGMWDLLVGLNLARQGRLAEAEAAARSSIRRFDAVGEVWFSVEPAGTLAGIAEARGDLDAAAEAYAGVLERCRSARQPSYEPLWLLRLAGVRARQGADDEADGLYARAVEISRSPVVTASALVGRAACRRRQGDLAGAARLLDAAEAQHQRIGLDSGWATLLAARAWLALAEGAPQDALDLGRQAVDRAGSGAEPAVTAVARTALAAAEVRAEPGPGSARRFLALVAERADAAVSFGLLPDLPDVEALARALKGT